MARLHFTCNLARLTPCPSTELPGATVAEVLTQYCAHWPAVRGYVLDDQGALRHHIAILIDGVQLHDRCRLLDPVQATSEIYVFQALSGG